MPKVFISHSSKDEEIVKDVNYNLRLAQIEPLIAEFEKAGFPPYRTIDQMIEQSDALFLFLTPNVTDSPYTQNWVTYELSAAHTLRKKAFVFEELNRQVQFPVPYLTHYFLYDPQRKEDRNKIIEIAKSQVPSVDVGAFVVGGILGAPFWPLGSLIGGAITSSLAADQRSRAIFSQDITCPYPNCGIGYKLYSELYDGFRWNCPSCRRELVWSLRDC